MGSSRSEVPLEPQNKLNIAEANVCSNNSMHMKYVLSLLNAYLCRRFSLHAGVCASLHACAHV